VGTINEEIRRVVEEQRLGYAATICPDGTHNLSPKGTTAVWDANRLIFADIRSPGTVENLRRNPTIVVNVVDSISRKGYRFKGTGMVLTEGDLMSAARRSTQGGSGSDPAPAIRAGDVLQRKVRCSMTVAEIRLMHQEASRRLLVAEQGPKGMEE
jgi:predicted pyridoxine 5'-phosphate oxidase superfamily flavin-nucleotide-binding protein